MNDRLRKYIDELFKDAPKNSRTEEYKEEILKNNEEKLADLIAGGFALSGSKHPATAKAGLCVRVRGKLSAVSGGTDTGIVRRRYQFLRRKEGTLVYVGRARRDRCDGNARMRPTGGMYRYGGKRISAHGTRTWRGYRRRPSRARAFSHRSDHARFGVAQAVYRADMDRL